MGNAKKIKRIIYFSAMALLVGIIFFVSRGPYISNALKRLILPELEHMTGRKVIAQKMYFNLFPLFVEAKGLKMFDEEGNRVLTADRVKGYVGLSGLLGREVILKRIVIKGPEIAADRNEINTLINNVKDYLAKENRKKITVKVRAIEVRDGIFSFYDIDRDAVITGEGLNGEFLPGETPRIKLHIMETTANVKNYPELICEIESSLFLEKDRIDIKNLFLRAYGSEMRAKGVYKPGGEGELKADFAFVVDSIKKFLGLKQRGEGKISANGDIRFGEGLPFVDIKLKGNFYMQTLMEILKVKERVEGWADVDGRISGALPKITGSADVRLRKGNLFGVEVDDLRCKTFYSNGIISFKNGKALLYNGHADAEASLKIPKVDHYEVKVNFTDVDSPGAFKLINWQPGVPKGKVRGEFYTSGSKFNPACWFDYENRETGEDVLGRVKKIRGSFKIQDKILYLNDTEIRTEKSTLGVNGAIDIDASTLNLKGSLETAAVTDLTLPYFSRLTGSGDFTGTITGKFNDPVIEGTARIGAASFDDYGLERIDGELFYRKNLLDVKKVEAKEKNEHHSIRGIIKFGEAKTIFDLKKPDFNLTASLRGADLDKIVKIFYRKLPVGGRMDSDLRIIGKGPFPEYSGYAVLTEGEAYNLPFNSASADFSYNYKQFVLKKTVFREKESVLKGEFKITDKEEFTFNASSERFFLRDAGLNGMPENASVSLNADGAGTFANPVIKLDAKISGGVFRGRPLGNGSVSASVKNKEILFNASLFDEKMKLHGKAFLSETLPWTARIDVSSGRYDFLFSGILKDMPEDLLVNLKGHADLSGDRKHFYASAFIDQMNMSLFGNSFSNESDIKLKIENRNVHFSEFTMRSGNTTFNLRGNVDIGKEYNLILDGSSALSPLKAFSQRISVLRGDADFNLAVIGKWDNPEINGSLNVKNASFGIKDVFQRLSSINGKFYFEGNKIVIQKFSGKLSGGDIDVSGLAYLSGFNIKRFYLDAKLNNVTTSVSKDFSVNFDGNVLYKGTLDSQNITGEVKINRARYKERVEWKSWLLKAAPKEKPRAEPTRIDKAVLNVNVYGAKNITVDNNIARADLKVDLVLRGTVGHPLLFGRVETRGGKVYFRNNEFNILNASADFADPNRINPVMEIVAQTIVKGYNIKLSLEGQLERFNLSLVSDPPLEETDILSLLTVGQIGKELKGLEGGIGAGEAAAFVTGKVQDVFEERLRSITGLDRVQVDPYVSKSTGTVGPRVTVSKRLLGDKLFVTYVSSVSTTEEQVIKLEYILGKNISLIGIRDERGSAGGDIKFRFEFK